MSKLTSFNARRRDWGLQRALNWQLMSALTKVGVHVNYVFVGADMLQIVERLAPELPPGYDTRSVGLQDLLPFADTNPDISRAFLEKAFARGDQCIANFFHDELVGYSFSAYARARANDALDVLVPDGFRYGYKAWTHPDHRQLHLSRMRGHVRRTTRPAGHKERSISYVETHNYASLLHGYRHPRLRGIRMGYVGWFTLFGRKIPFRSPRARWIGFELVRKDDTRPRQYVW